MELGPNPQTFETLEAKQILGYFFLVLVDFPKAVSKKNVCTVARVTLLPLPYCNIVLDAFPRSAGDHLA
jgi:hypothetical protein